MKKLLIVSLVFSISICSLYSQNKTIKGRVISEDFETLPGVSIMIKDTVKVGRTDMKGFFQVDIPLSEERIQFSFLGLELTTIELEEKCNNIDVVMMSLYTYDFITLKQADRKRKKRYKNFLRFINKLSRKVYLKLNAHVTIARLNLFINKKIKIIKATAKVVVFYA